MTLERFDWAQPDGMERFQQLFRYAQVGRCVNGVTHDINNYLGAMLAYSELVQMDSGIADDSKMMLDKIIEAVEKCSKLVTGITAIARKEREANDIVDVHTLVADMVRLREYAMRVDKITWEVSCADAVPSVYADSPKVQLAILYLLFNAEEAVQSAEKKIVKIKILREAKHIFVDIWNSGPEIDSEDREAVFDPGMTSKDGYHLGFGLSVARDVALLHKGSLTYEPDRGFRLALPIAGPDNPS